MNQQSGFLFSVADAIDARDVSELGRLLRENPEQLSVYTPFAGGTWLHYACMESTLDIVKVLLQLGFDLNAGDQWHGATPITRAAASGKADIVKHLLECGATLDVSTSARNALFSAILGHSPEAAALLLKHGIDSTVRYNNETWKEMDAVAFAMLQGEREIARLIALHNSAGDESAADAALADGLGIADANTVPSGACGM